MLAANLKDKADSDQPLKLDPSVIVTREGVKVGVVGFTSVKTVATTVAGRASGLEVTPLEASVGAAMNILEKDAPDVVLALTDDCFVTLQKVLATHAEWKIFELKPDGTKSLNASRKTVATTGEEDADLLALRDRWQKKLDDELGQTIGFTKTGFKEEAPQLRTLVATALMEGAKADAALLNKKGIRASLPKEPITAASVYSIIPFDNAVVTVKVKGEVITKLKTHPEAFMVAPGKLDPEKDYVLATTESIYFGGDGLGLDVVAPELELTGQVWQTPVIAWLTRQGCSEKKPLEKIVK